MIVFRGRALELLRTDLRLVKRRAGGKGSGRDAAADPPPRPPPSAVAKADQNYIISAMSTVAEIESAIEKLSPQEQRELAAWYEERQALLNASDMLFQAYDNEEQAG